VSSSSSRRTHPERLNVTAPNAQTIELARQSGARVIAEIGVYEGHTSVALAELATERGGSLHLFDYQERVDPLVERLHAAGHTHVVGHGNSQKLMDSYNWSLMELMRSDAPPTFDYVFIDGAHVWGIDALTFFLADLMLADGGHVDFDDYTWSLAASETMNPDVFPATAELHTPEQIEERQVGLIVDLLVRRDPRYVEVLPNKAYRKGPSQRSARSRFRFRG
jgi:predicted O-methyltransferase YrrM